MKGQGKLKFKPFNQSNFNVNKLTSPISNASRQFFSSLLTSASKCALTTNNFIPLCTITTSNARTNSSILNLHARARAHTHKNAHREILNQRDMDLHLRTEKKRDGGKIEPREEETTTHLLLPPVHVRKLVVAIAISTFPLTSFLSCARCENGAKSNWLLRFSLSHPTRCRLTIGAVGDSLTWVLLVGLFGSIRVGSGPAVQILIRYHWA